MQFRNTGQGGRTWKQSGFTLVEMMITIVILGVLVGIAAPNFTDMINNGRSEALAEDFAGALNYTRSEAVKRGGRVTICASTDGANCTAADTWDQGWIVFVDDAASDNAGVPVINQVLRVWEIDDGDASIQVVQVAATNFIRFTSLGTLGRFTNTSVSARNLNCVGNNAVTMTVGAAGLITVEKTDC